MSELYRTSADAPDPGSDADAANQIQYEAVPEQRTSDDLQAGVAGERDLPEPRTRQEAAADTWDRPRDAPDDSRLAQEYDGDLEALLAEEQKLPEPRTRQEAAAETWDRPRDAPDDSRLAQEYDGDLEALLAEEQKLPEPRTRQEAAAETWDRPRDAPDDSRLAQEYDGDLEALLAEEQKLPEPRTRQEAAADTWDRPLDATDYVAAAEVVRPSSNSQATTDTRADASTSTDGARTLVPDRVTPRPDVRQFMVHTDDGNDASIAVLNLPPEVRTFGDDIPTGIGSKPTGEQLLEAENGDVPESRLDRLVRKATEDADDLNDGSGNIAESIHDFNLPGPGSGHAYEGYAAHEHHVSEGPTVNDLVGGVVLMGVVLTAGARHWFRDRHGGDARWRKTR